MNAVDLLIADHESIEDLFEKFEELTERAEKGQAELVERITHELVTHAAIEEQIFYPAVRAAMPEVDLEVREDLEEHAVVERLLADLEKMDSTDERYRPKVLVLIESTRHHIEEEQEDLFPKVRKAIDEDTLVELGEAMAELKEHAPTRPHPHSPDQPPLNIVTDAVAAIIDRLRNTISR